MELLSLIEQVNVLRPNAFYIVDSFGSIKLEEFDRFLAIIHHNLARDIKLGFHSHNNMQLAFANAIKMCNANLKREIVLDCSIYGMGRGAGNLNTELIMDYLNSAFDASYQSFFLLEVIDTLLGFLFAKHSWGFSPAQYLSASLDCHPNYATYLITKNSIPLLTIWNILHQIPKEKRLSFDEKLIEKLLLEYLCKAHSEPKGEIGLHKDSKVLLIASGKSVIDYQTSVESALSGSLSISINHKGVLKSDYYFFSNQKRFDEFHKDILESQIIITSNIITQKPVFAVIDIQKLVFIEGRFTTNATLILLNFLIAKGVESVTMAGFDGYSLERENYSYEETDVQTDKETIQAQNHSVALMLASLNCKIQINFLTPSLYKEYQ